MESKMKHSHSKSGLQNLILIPFKKIIKMLTLNFKVTERTWILYPRSCPLWCCGGGGDHRTYDDQNFIFIFNVNVKTIQQSLKRYIPILRLNWAFPFEHCLVEPMELWKIEMFYQIWICVVEFQIFMNWIFWIFFSWMTVLVEFW